MYTVEQNYHETKIIFLTLSIQTFSKFRLKMIKMIVTKKYAW